uniref:(California timema) hypothetical protein n=1 Tax=Timema californicum TaxID=61474 RepID=A0A7R9JFV1_TIMCA|nr:unnamed protein product [Timema californicum]
MLENASVIFLTGEESSWHGQLLSCLNNGQGECSRLYVVANIKPREHGIRLIKELSREPKAYKLRYIFILDKNAPKFSLNEDLYQQQLIQDLLVNFYDNGSWGSFRQLPIDELRELFPQNGLLPELR